MNRKEKIIYKGKEYKADGLIFDVDGTIWDSTGVVTEAWNNALADTGFDTRVTADRLKGLFGLPMIDIMRDILPGVEEPRLRHFEEVCNEYEKNYILERSGEPYRHIAETIKALSEQMPVIIVSNCQAGYIELMMDHLKLREYVTDFVCPDYTGKLKADNILLMAEKHGLKYPVYIGDTQMDADACKKADVPIIFCRYGFGTVEEPDAVIDKPEDLLKILGMK
ncbi:MAG: HAD family hydrolase [Lachnospiraceae bacterium]|nr:HAD family hydrolase [Lachnospiraceae bacterium]